MILGASCFVLALPFMIPHKLHGAAAFRIFGAFSRIVDSDAAMDIVHREARIKRPVRTTDHVGEVSTFCFRHIVPLENETTIRESPPLLIPASRIQEEEAASLRIGIKRHEGRRSQASRFPHFKHRLTIRQRKRFLAFARNDTQDRIVTRRLLHLFCKTISPPVSSSRA